MDALTPLFRRLEVHVLSAERLHGDDTTVPVLAKSKTNTGRICVYVRDDKPFGGPAPPGAVFYYSHDRSGEHPQAHPASYSGIFEADAYDGCDSQLAESRRRPPFQPTSGRADRSRIRQGFSPRSHRGE